jgi:hypothetical protein
MARNKLRLDEDPVDVGVAIKRGFERTVASSDRPARIDGDYLLGVAVWWMVLFAALSIVGVTWVAAAVIAAILCGFWPVVLLFDRTRR